jgi:hypothetical protein
MTSYTEYETRKRHTTIMEGQSSEIPAMVPRGRPNIKDMKPPNTMYTPKRASAGGGFDLGVSEEDDGMIARGVD